MMIAVAIFALLLSFGGFAANFFAGEFVTSVTWLIATLIWGGNIYLFTRKN